MSTLNVDNINEYTTDGKVNVGHDIKLASGKKVLNSSSQQIGSLVKITSGTVSSGTSIDFDNCFSNDFRNYKIFTNTTGTVSLEARLRYGGSNNTSSVYGSMLHYVYIEGSTSASVDRTTNGQHWRWTYQASGGSNNIVGAEHTVYAPYESDKGTVMTGLCMSQWNNDNSLAGYMSGHYSTVASFDGISILDTAGDNWTGEVAIYGIVK
tara:strand:- start:731 stop:1357 length:627 start_codon:yes stop_codon:yes gene_type:complete